MSESNRVALRYVEETDYGTTPADSPDWQAVRYTSETLSGTPNTITSGEVRADRSIADQTKAGLSVGGDINIEFSELSFDDFLEAAMCSVWATNILYGELVIGTRDRSFSIEKHMGDIDKYIAYTGMRVSSMELSFPYGEVVTGKFGFMGNGVATPTTSVVGSGIVNAVNSSKVFTASTDVKNINIAGAPPTGIHIKSISLSLDNQYRPTEAIGSDAPVDVRKGTVNVTGTIEAFLSAQSFDWYSRILNQTSTKLSWAVENGENNYAFYLPNVKLTGEAPQSGGLDQDVMITVDFTALYRPSAKGSLRIVRS